MRCVACDLSAIRTDRADTQWSTPVPLPRLRQAASRCSAGVLKTEADAKGFFEGKGVKVTTPDVEAFRTQVLKMFSESKFAANWPKGLLERINQAGM